MSLNQPLGITKSIISADISKVASFETNSNKLKNFLQKGSQVNEVLSIFHHRFVNYFGKKIWQISPKRKPQKRRIFLFRVSTFTCHHQKSHNWEQFQVSCFWKWLIFEDVCFSSVLPHWMLTAFKGVRGSLEPFSKGCICLWNLNDPELPTKYVRDDNEGVNHCRILSCGCEIICCTFGPDSSSTIIAGTAAGTLVVWDLREYSLMHSFGYLGDHKIEVRRPTYSTDGLFKDNHEYPVVNMVWFLLFHSSRGLWLLVSKK